MPTYVMSPQEGSLIAQYSQTTNAIASDLNDLLYQANVLSYGNLRSAENSITQRLNRLGLLTVDIQFDLRAIMDQMYDLIYRGVGAPFTNFEGDPAPLLMSATERANFDGTLASIGYDGVSGYYIENVTFIVRSLGASLAKFLAARGAQMPAIVPTSGTTPNVSVSNKSNGWQIVYTPYYVTSERGLGGPSSPVDGYLNPGRYRFGIKMSTPAQWDSSSWGIPKDPKPYVPLP